MQEYLDLVTLWYRDVLLYKATGDSPQLVFRDELFRLKKQAEVLTYGGLEKILKEIEATRNRLRANVNFELAAELLLLTIKGDRI